MLHRIEGGELLQSIWTLRLERSKGNPIERSPLKKNGIVQWEVVDFLEQNLGQVLYGSCHCL